MVAASHCMNCSYFDHKTALVAPFNTSAKDADTHCGPPTSDDDGDCLGPGVGGVLGVCQVHVLHAPHHLHPPHHVVPQALELAVLVAVPVQHRAALAVHLLLGEPEPEGGHLVCCLHQSFSPHLTIIRVTAAALFKAQASVLIIESFFACWVFWMSGYIKEKINLIT